MAIDISEYLDIIAGDSEGEEVIQAIHDASLALGLDMYKTADIADLLEDIKTRVFGREIRMDIHEILKRLSEAEPESGVASSVHGSISTITNVHGSFANGALYGNTSYRMVEYLKSTGTQYIVTDIVPTDSMKIETTVQFDGLRLDQPTQNQGIFGYYTPARVSENYPCYAIMCNCGYYDEIIRGAIFYYNYPWTSDIDGMIHLYKINPTGQQQLILQHGVCRYVDLTTDVSGIPATRPLPTVGMPIFGCYSANTGTPGYFPYTACDLTMHNLKIYDGQERLHDLRPAERTQDNELGLLDVMTGVFYTNTGTGTFAKGGYV